MTRLTPICAALAAATLACPTLAWCAGPLQRFTLVVGANLGGADRPALRYAISDAERFAKVMIELGGVHPDNEIVLRQPKLQQLTEALDLLSKRVSAAPRIRDAGGPGRTEVIVYYSGHADEKGLLLGEDRYSYRTLRDRLDQIPADVKIAVLDACASGAFTRMKGGRARPAFLVDESAEMRGHAFLTSSAETEAAQESDRIRASYFTHYLVSGFRGAADLSDDGKVTLSEAYQFAFRETLGRTVNTRGGAQHPSYDINMSGTGDVVITDVRQTTATLVLGQDLEGRFFIRSSSQELVVELYKPAGRRVELGIEPGSYEIRVERARDALVAKTDIRDGAQVLLDGAQFGQAPREATRSRGGFDPPPFAVAGRNRVELQIGVWRVGDPSTGPVDSTGVDARDVFGGLQYTRYVRENLAVTFAVQGLGSESGALVATDSIFSGSAGAIALPFGVRWNPVKGQNRIRALKPFLAFGVGPVIGHSSGSFVGRNTVSAGSHTRATLGGYAGGGVDVHVARSFSLGLNVGYNGMMNFSEPVGIRDNFNGVQIGLGIGWLFGRGYTEGAVR